MTSKSEQDDCKNEENMLAPIIKRTILSGTVGLFILFQFSCYSHELKNSDYLSKIGNYSVGVYIYNRTIEKYQNKPEELIKTCSEIGINEVYLSFSRKRFNTRFSQYKKLLNGFIKRFHQAKIKVYALSFSTPTIIFNERKTTDIISTILAYNDSSDEFSRFDGITADLEPHMLKESKKWGKTPFYWTKDGYKGDNLKLLNLTFDVLRLIRKNTGTLQLSEAVPAFYLNNFEEKHLLNQFINTGCNYVILMAYNRKTDKIIKMGKKALSSSTKPNSVVICVKTSIDTKGGGGGATTFHGITRVEMIKNIKRIVETLKGHAAFKGIAFFEYEGLINIWNKH